jgi:hypothetical protein
MHTPSIRPVLAQFATSGNTPPPVLRDSLIDPDDSMIRMAGALRPLVVELLETRPSRPATLETILTEANTDPADRDLVRAGEAQFESLITRTYEDPIDPDTIRADSFVFVTLLTKSDQDPIDPDTVRLSC